LCYHDDLTCSFKCQGKRLGKVGEGKNYRRREVNYKENKLRGGGQEGKEGMRDNTR